MGKEASQTLHFRRVATIVVSFLLIILLTISVTINFTKASFSSGNTNEGRTVFGSITLNDITNNFDIKNAYDESISKVLPGDDVRLEFMIANQGTADMFARFKLELTSQTSDLSALEVSLYSATYLKNSTLYDVEYVLYDFDQRLNNPTGVEDKWYVRRYPIVGNPDMSTNDPPDSIVLNIHFDGDKMDNSYINTDIEVALFVETVQWANNGLQNDVTMPGYDVTWSE